MSDQAMFRDRTLLERHKNKITGLIVIVAIIVVVLFTQQMLTKTKNKSVAMQTSASHPTVETNPISATTAPSTSPQNVQLSFPQMLTTPTTMPKLTEPPLKNTMSAEQLITQNNKQGVAAQPIGATTSGFTIQLIAGSNEEAIKRFIANHPLTPPLQYQRVERDGKSWYIVTYGRYKTEQEARLAINALSPELQKHKPWIKPAK